MKTATEPHADTQPEEQRPTLTLSRVIEVMPNGISFSGWGPNVTGTSIIKSWN